MNTKMSDKIKISVVIPVYNTERYIKDCLSSIAGQSYQDIEIILVNDGSKDRSVEIAKDFLQTTNIPYQIIEQENSGVAVARNRGISEATGEWVIAIDSDDMLHCDTFSIAMAHVRDEQIIALDYSNDKNDDIKITDSNIEIISGSEAFKGYFTRKRQFISPGMIIKKSFLIENNIDYDAGCLFAEDDIYVWKTLCCASKVMHIRTPLYYYVFHDNSTMTTSNVSKFYSIKEASVSLEKKFVARSINANAYRYLFLMRHYLGVLHVVAKIQSYQEYKELVKFYELEDLFKERNKKLTFTQRITFFIQIKFKFLMYNLYKNL